MIAPVVASALRRVPRTVAAVGASIAMLACSGSRHANTAAPPPRAEFLVASADSTFWVATTSGVIRVRGAPLLLAHYGGRFYELYTADDDRSYPDAVLVGERLYRRDLLTGDSTIVFSDTAVAHVAEIYARTHPDERPLAPDEEADPDPATSATAELDVLDAFGPFVSFEYHLDIELPHRTPWHSTRHGVLDLRTGSPASVADLVGSDRGRQLLAEARQSFETVRDSAIRARQALSAEERRAVDLLERRQFDPRCFALEYVDGRPAITFGIPGGGEGTAGHLVELEPITVDSSADWWRAIRATLPRSDSSDDDVWPTPTYTVIARYDTSGDVAHLSLADSARREWPIASTSAPLHRIDWLDRPPPTTAERAALGRAFDQAATYDENTRVALGRNPRLFAASRTARSSPRRRLARTVLTVNRVR